MTLRSVREWRCKRCGRLLGVIKPEWLDLKYKEARFRVIGSEYSAEAICPDCSCRNDISNQGGRISEERSAHRPQDQ